MKTILVPTDFSEHAFYALKVAACIAKKINAELILVHAYNFPSAEFAENYYYKEFYDQTKIQANKELDKLIESKYLKGIKINEHFVTNMLLWELVTDKRFKHVDLVVIGSHGKSGLSNMFIGSNTEKVVRLANAPVLTIKKDDDNFNINKIVFASNFYGESYSVFEKIKFFADLYKAHIDLLKVITPKNFEPTSVSKKLMEDFAKKFKLSNFAINIYNETIIEKGITDFSDDTNADMIAIETHGRTGISYLINGSLAEDVVNHEDRPVLSVKIKDIPTNISGLRWHQEKVENTSAESKGNEEKHYPKFSTI